MSKKSKARAKKVAKVKLTPHVATSSYVYGEDCHTGPIEVMQIGKASIYAGSKDEVHEFDDWKLMIVCGDAFLAPKCKLFFSELAAKLLPASVRRVTVPPFFRIDWSDGSDPGLAKKWWLALVAALVDIDGMVSINCQGGHGRTGTALAILAYLSGACSGDEDPVAWVREKYCDEAVETIPQVEYIERITGAEVQVDHSNKYVAPVTQPAFPSPHSWEKDRGGVGRAYGSGGRPLTKEEIKEGVGSEKWWQGFGL